MRAVLLTGQEPAPGRGRAGVSRLPGRGGDLQATQARGGGGAGGRDVPAHAGGARGAAGAGGRAGRSPTGGARRGRAGAAAQASAQAGSQSRDQAGGRQERPSRGRVRRASRRAGRPLTPRSWHYWRRPGRGWGGQPACPCSGGSPGRLLQRQRLTGRGLELPASTLASAFLPSLPPSAPHDRGCSPNPSPSLCDCTLLSTHMCTAVLCS